MTTLDWIIVGVTLVLALYGYGQGFVVGVFSLAGFALGGFAGTRLGPHLLPDGDASPYAPLFGLLGALLIGGILALILQTFGIQLRRVALRAHLGVIDGLLGAVLTACIVLAIAWLLAAVALQAGDRSLRRDVQRSAVLSRLNAVLPPSGPVLGALARLDPLPQIEGPSARVGPPPPAIARRPAVRAAARSVVRVLGTACGLGVEGSGWVARDDLVVTNAHVVAGQDDTAVQAGGSGALLDAQAIWFDPRDDIALLRVGGLDRPALALAPDAPAGSAAAILGFPRNGPYRVDAARIGETSTVLSPDAYGDGPVSRPVLALRGRVQPGNSGGPVVNARGSVLATVFAATVGTAHPGGYAVPNAVVRDALAHARAPVSTGPCAR